MEKNNDFNMIEDIHTNLMLGEYFIYVSDAMNEKKINNYIDMCSYYNDVYVFQIDFLGEKRLVIKYNPPMEQRYDVRKLYNEGQKAYHEKDYEKSFDCFSKLLLIYDNPNGSVYSFIGLCYLKKRDKKNAINFLMVGSCLAKKEHKKYDYTDLVLSLKGYHNGESIKKTCRFKIADFNDSAIVLNEEEFLKIHEYILKSGLDVETACCKLELSLEETCLVKLSYAVKYYTQNNFEVGDRFFKSVERTPDKPKIVKKALEQIRHDKQFYCNRKKENEQIKILALKPNKTR